MNGFEFILKKMGIYKKVVIFLTMFIFLISLVPTKDLIFSKSELNDEYEFILSMKNKLPSDLYIISYNTPAIISTIHRKSITPHLFIELRSTLESKNNVILFKDYWWYRRIEDSNKIEEELKKHYSFQLIEKDSNYEFYNLTLLFP